MVPRSRALVAVPLAALALAAPATPALAKSSHKRTVHCTRHRRHHGRCAVVKVHVKGISSSATAPTVGPCTNTNMMPTSSNLDQIENATLCLVNKQRVVNGLEPLKENAKLDQAASYHSADMVANNYFDHTGSAGDTLESRLERVAYIPSGWSYMLGENIATATGSLATPASIVNAWMNSPEHRANILTADFQASGVGVAIGVPAQFDQDGLPGATYTQDFGAVAPS